MALNMLFGAQTNEVNVNKQGALEYLRDAKRDETKPNTMRELSNLAQVAGKAYKAYEDAQSVTDANSAKQDYLKLIMSPGYRDASETGRADMLEGVYSGIQDRSQAYQNSFIGYSSGEFTRRYDGRNEELRVSKLNSAGSEFTGWLEEDSGQATEGFTPDNTMYEVPLNNKEAGYTAADWIEMKHKSDPTLGKVELGQVVLNEIHEQSMLEISSARTPQELKEAETNIAELQKSLKSPFLLDSKQKEAVIANNANRTVISNAITAKREEFKQAAINRIQMNKDLNNDSVYQHYKQFIPYSEFVTAYGPQAENKFQDFFREFEIHQIAREKFHKFDASETTNWALDNDVTKELYQQALDTTIFKKIGEGNFQDAGEIIVNQGATDNKRLANTRQAINSLMNSDDIGYTYNAISKLMLKSPDAFNTLFTEPKDRAKLIALGPLNAVLGGRLQDTWKYVQGSPGFIPEAESMFASKRDEISTLTHKPEIPMRMRKEIETMYTTMASYGLQHEAIMDGITKYIDAKPYELNYGNVPQQVKEHMEYHLDNFKVDDTFLLYSDPVNGYFVQESPYGETYNIIDKQGLKNYSGRINKIKEYNREHRVGIAFENVFGNITSFPSKMKHAGGRDMFEVSKPTFFNEEATGMDKLLYGTWRPGVGYIDIRGEK